VELLLIWLFERDLPWLEFPFDETFLGTFWTKEGLMPLSSFRCISLSFLNAPGLPFAEVLPEEDIQQVFDEEGVRFGQDDDAVYTPAVTLWAFLSQVLFNDKHRSCLAATARVATLMVALGLGRCSDNTGAYCRARRKIPAVVIQRLALQVADRAEASVPTQWLWMNKHVHLVDGVTVSGPDTPANQAAFPQPNAQKPGLGFPVIRMVVLLSLATAMIGGAAMGPYSGKVTGETALLRQLFDRLQPGDVLLGDRYFCSYFMIALLVEQGVDVVTRLHQRRSFDFRRGTRLGQGDHVVDWMRPVKPKWMDQATYERMPESIQVREILVQVNQPGFRVKSFVAVTTLLDADTYSKNDIADLYHRRWLVELDIRSIKTIMGMDILRCKTPDMLEKEIWTCLLAYNLIRKAMLEAALASDHSPRQLSFTAALQKIAASFEVLICCTEHVIVVLVQTHLRHMANHPVGHRPDRVEPRAIKRRPKKQKLLTTPREDARAQLLANAEQ